jgi:hypothetical protein
MPGRTTVPVALLSLAACASSPPLPRVAAPAVPPPPAPSAPAAPRLFHASEENSFWVSHGPEGDRFVDDGVRLEVSPAGEVVAAAWDLGLVRAGDTLAGALAVPARLGGGFVHWTPSHVFRSREFTSPLEPVALGVPGGVGVRGARSGLSSVIVLTDGGPRALVPGHTRLSPLADPGVADEAAVSASRALVLDVFGRARETDDAGRSFLDLRAATGGPARRIVVGDGDLWLEGWDGRMLVGAGGRVDPPEQGGRQGYEGAKALQIQWKGARAEEPSYAWAFQQTSPLAAAVASGAAVGDGTAIGVVDGYAARVDLRTGKVVSVAQGWIPSGLECDSIRAPDAVLLACSWRRYDSYGSYVLRSVGGAPPEVEKVFTDDGDFVADDRGAIGFEGSCGAASRFFDPEEQARSDGPGDERPTPPVLCIRRAPGEWVERRVDPGPGMELEGWVPRLDGTAVALAQSTDPLPPARESAPRVADRGDVRLVRLYRETPGWGFGWGTATHDRGRPIDRRFSVRDDGAVDGWLAPTGEGEGEHVTVGVTIDARGVPTVHDPAPGAAVTVAAGAFAVSISRDGDLYESTDHGRSFRFAGRSPVPPVPVSGAACSALGCALGPVVRVGWGDGAVAPRVSTEALAEPEPPAPAPRLACAPQGAPTPVAARAPSKARQTLATPWGETLEIVRDAPPPDPAPAQAAPAPKPATPPAAAPPAAPSKKGRPSTPAVPGAQALVVRRPFSPLAPARRLDATGATVDLQRRAAVLPLLGPKGDVDLLLAGGAREIVVAGDRVTSLPAFEPRRWISPHDAAGGLATAEGHAIVLGELRRRLTLEEHGGDPPPPPVYLGMEREATQRRAVSLARRDDGAIGLLVLDGPAPETAGVAPIDRAAAGAGAIARLAPWSTLAAADDPRCAKDADPGAYTAIVLVDPAAWLSLDAASLPGVALGHQGMALVRWGRARVCLLGLEASVTDARRGEPGRPWILSARWGGGDRGAAIRGADLVQALACRVGPPS